MRPSVLDPLFASASALPGVGPKSARLYDRLLGRDDARALDLLFHLPYGLVDNRLSPSIRDAPIDSHVVIAGRVAEHRIPKRYSSAPLSVLIEDEAGDDVLLVFFRNNFDWVLRALPIGEIRWFSGDLKLWNGHRQIAHPRIIDQAALKQMREHDPVYGLTEGLHQRNVQKAVEAALARLPKLPEWIDPALMQREKWPSFAGALAFVHAPKATADLSPETVARKRLAYDELLSQQLALRLVRAKTRRLRGRPTEGDGRISGTIEQALPYSLTNAQRAALSDIRGDMASDRKMLRLLQGDVGSGKTIVALLAMASAVEAGRQAALMAPTEILARQHFERIAPLARAAGMRLGLLTGRDKAAERRASLEALAAGEMDIVVGTHALVQDSVAFRDLALAIVDEQHRFGVHQRLALGEKGEATDVLVMTATPIPRTLVLTYFGDMDVSNLTEKPAGRQRIDTRAVPLERIDDVIAGIERATREGARAYWVCPLVAENEELEVAAAQDRFEDLQKRFGARVGLVHGQMKGREKDAAMLAFQSGETQVLVATTVIEVGVDVPEATIIVIEHAERFGLAQLHQLRGRVGRGAQKSSCILLYKGPLGETAKARLSILRESDDGFRLAEEDLKLRGEGEILGTRQSGMPGFRLADLSAHAVLLKLAREDVDGILERDEALASERGQALRALLYLFERDEAVRLLRSG
ncbi:MAG: ATP-dependent DNA helicase RecG [Hyphomicrobiales bacterium]|nr:ATP-dependent DNA helicase RecG [Hyphomicrobiales bacterium]